MAAEEKKARLPEGPQDRLFRECMQLLEEESVLLGVVRDWVAKEELSARQLDWLASVAGHRTFRIVRNPSIQVIPHYEEPEDGDPAESAAALQFLEFLWENEQRLSVENRPRVKICRCCNRPFRTVLGFPNKNYCTEAHRVRHTRKARRESESR